MSYISAWRTGNTVVVWERTEEGRFVKQYDAPYYFYAPHDDGKYKSIFGEQLGKITCKNWDDLQEAVISCERDKITTYESDISPELKILSTHYYNKPEPKLHITFLDIEVDYDPEIGFSSTSNPYAPINAIALHHYWKNESIVFAVPPPNFDVRNFDESLRKLSTVILCKDEKDLLQKFLREIEDSDCLSGWNSAMFDIPMICKRIEIALGSAMLDRMSFPNCGKKTVRYREVEMFGKVSITADLRGRIALDYLDLFKKYEMDKRATYKLEAIADEILPHLPKLKYDGSLAQLYKNDFNHFVRYNIRDTEILKGFEDKLGYVNLANVMYHSATGLASQVFGTIRLADLSIINYCHNVMNVKVPDWTPKEDGSIEGAIVLYPQIGMHDGIASVDINSLYPSAIRSINISPETLIGQFPSRMGAWELINKDSEQELLFEYNNGKVEYHTAKEWKQVLKDNKWAVSGYGTVFDQNKIGVIPALLAEWYTLRKKYQAQKALFGEKAKEVGKQDPRYQEYMDQYTYFDRLQYVYKIKLNSTYGALTNYRFRFFDLRTGESTTGTGRMILKHQVRKIAEILDGNYNIDFPSYKTIADAEEKGHGPEAALFGPKFNGKFQSESIVYGDTDSCYFLTHGETNEQCIMIADHVADLVNASFQKFMQDSFLCNPGFDTLIKAGREAVADRGIFVDKKRYVLHLINLDGKVVDKLKVMGLEMRKTTTPKIIQDFLKDTVSMILAKKDWDDINKFIIDYRDDVLINMSVLDLGLPKGCNDLEEYTAKKLAGRDSDGKKYRIPGHISAAIHYNMCLEDFNDKENLPLMSGMRLKVFYLTRPVNGFKNIALPVDADYLPEWFTDNFEIDRTEHSQKLIDANLGHIFNAIGREVPTRQTLLLDAMYGY
jgi:DNA polymerase elongation subunit (family B)